MRGHGGPPPKCLDSDNNFKPKHTLLFVAIYALYNASFLNPNIRYFVAILRFVAIFALFGRLGAKSVFFVCGGTRLPKNALIKTNLNIATK